MSRLVATITWRIPVDGSGRETELQRSALAESLQDWFSSDLDAVFRAIESATEIDVSVDVDKED